MTTWLTPATWVTGAVTVAQMNTEVRDHFNWLKDALDLVTAGASDVGTGTYLDITRPASTDPILTGQLSGDAFPRVRIRAGGSYQMGDGTAAPISYLSLSAGALQLDQVVTHSQLLRLLTKAGSINDTDIPGSFTGAGSGMIGLDTSYNSGKGRLWVRVGSTWRYVALV